MSESCCLCQLPLPTDHRRKKKLYGSGCTIAREVLQAIVWLTPLTDSFQPSAFMCYSCEKLLLNIRSCERKLESLRGEVLKSLCSRQCDRSKRALEGRARATSPERGPPSKQFCSVATCSQSNQTGSSQHYDSQISISGSIVNLLIWLVQTTSLPTH